MSMITNTVTRYDATFSVREDLSDKIYNISPTETPFMNNIGRDKASNTYFEWQTDDLAAASTTNAQLEGDDLVATTDSRAATHRVGNVTQISRKLVTVTGTVEAVDKAGMRSKLAYELAKASAELKRDMESTLLTTQTAVTGGNTTIRKTASLSSWIITNFTAGGGTTSAPAQMSSGAATTNLDGYPNTALVQGTTITFTETILKSMVSQLYTQGGKPDVLWVGPFNKGLVSAFTGIATRYRDVPAGKQAQIIGAADVYVSDFGTINVVPNRFQPEALIYLGDPEYASVSYLRNFQTVVLAKTGDAERRMLLVEYGLRVRQQKAFALKVAASTS